MTRRIKVETIGDYFKRKTAAGIRLKGKWLQNAGFKPGEHCQVTFISPGIIRLSMSTNAGIIK